jgi:TRAP-type C4-dicarboxylate transport system permease small subunit
MHFFGLYGTLCFLAGFILSAWLVFAKFWYQDYAITNKPAFYMALTVMIIGMQLFLAGFVAELVARSSPERNAYMIEKKLGLQAT